MKNNSLHNIRDLRKSHNLELIRRMRDGDPLKSFDSKASWYPPRPIIEKDQDAVAELYGLKKPKKKLVAKKIESEPGVAPVISLAAFQKEEEEWQQSTPEAS